MPSGRTKLWPFLEFSPRESSGDSSVPICDSGPQLARATRKAMKILFQGCNWRTREFWTSNLRTLDWSLLAKAHCKAQLPTRRLQRLWLALSDYDHAEPLFHSLMKDQKPAKKHGGNSEGRMRISNAVCVQAGRFRRGALGEAQVAILALSLKSLLQKLLRPMVPKHALSCPTPLACSGGHAGV